MILSMEIDILFESHGKKYNIVKP